MTPVVWPELAEPTERRPLGARLMPEGRACPLEETVNTPPLATPLGSVVARSKVVLRPAMKLGSEGFHASDVAPPKNMPFTIAFGPARRVKRKRTCPVMSQIRYWPAVNDDRVRELSTAPVAAFSTSIVWDRPAALQSRKYRPVRWRLASAMVKSIVKQPG